MANEPAAGEQKVGVKIISQTRGKLKTQATRNKATQLDHQELFRHVAGDCNDTLVIVDGKRR